MSKIAIITCVSIVLPYFLSGPALGRTQQEKVAPIKAPYKVEQVSASTYVIHEPVATPTPEKQGFMNDPAFVVGISGIFVIDSGGAVQVDDMMLKLIRVQNIPPTPI